LKKPTGKADFGPVGQVAAVGQVHAQHRVARFQQGKIGRHVGLGSRVGLHVGAVGAEKGQSPVDGQLFGPVDELTSPIVPFFGVAFGVLVGQNAALDRHDRPAGDILGGNQLQVRLLTYSFIFDDPGDFGVRRADQIGIQWWFLLSKGVKFLQAALMPPPSKGVSNQVFRISSARMSPITRPPMTRMLASL
jgi:hypothetical protein